MTASLIMIMLVAGPLAVLGLLAESQEAGRMTWLSVLRPVAVELTAVSLFAWLLCVVLLVR